MTEGKIARRSLQFIHITSADWSASKGDLQSTKCESSISSPHHLGMQVHHYNYYYLFTFLGRICRAVCCMLYEKADGATASFYIVLIQSLQSTMA